MRIVIKSGGVLVLLVLLSIMAVAALRVGKTPLSSNPSGNDVPTETNPTGGKNPVLPVIAESLIADGGFATGFGSLWTQKGFPETVNPSQEGGRRFLHLSVVPTTPEPWSVRLGQVIATPLKRGDPITFRGWLRSPESLVLHFYVEESAKPHGKTMGSQLFLTPEWREYRVVGTANRDYAAGEAQLMLFFGSVPGTVDIADFRLTKEGSGATAAP